MEELQRLIWKAILRIHGEKGKPGENPVEYASGELFPLSVRQLKYRMQVGNWDYGNELLPFIEKTKAVEVADFIKRQVDQCLSVNEK